MSEKMIDASSTKSRDNSKSSGAFSIKVLCREQCSKPLSIVEANSQESSLRFCVDRVDLKDWPPILNAIAKNRSLSKIHVCSRTHCKKIREHIDSEEKLVKLG